MRNGIVTIALLRHGGSHLIRPIVSHLGFDIVEPGNFGAPLDVAVGPVIVFLRDPRNRMVATMRWWRGKPRKAEFLVRAGDTDDAQLRYLLEGQQFLDEMLRWAMVWCKWTNPRPLVVYFEHVTPAVVTNIATHLGLPVDKDRDDDIYRKVYGHGRTYTGKHSNWRDSFGPLATEYWDNNGGSELLALMGYT